MLDLPGRQRDLTDLLVACAAAAGGRGRTVFVAGDTGSGRSALLRTLASQAGRIKPRQLVLAGAFAEGRYVSWDLDRGATEKVLAMLRHASSGGEWLAGVLRDAGVPVAGLVAQAFAASARPLDLLEHALGQRERPDLADLAPRVLRGLCEQHPVVCILDNADQATPGGLWGDLVLGFARRIANDLPLALVLGVHGPAQLGPHEDNESDSLNVARLLTHDNLASWHPLTPLDINELRRWTGPATHEALAALLAVTGGRAEWAAALWLDWRKRGVVEDVTDGRWRFTPGRERYLDDVDDLLAERLRRRIASNDLNALAWARRLLETAALEGERFTPAAIAGAHNRDVEKTIDFLDDNLTCDDAHPDGLVIDHGWLHVEDEHGRRDIAVYGFARKLDWLTLSHHGLTVAEQRNLSRPLAHTLARLYGREADPRTLARLFNTAGDTDRARHYQRIADVGVNREIILQRARDVLRAPDPTAPGERQRSHQQLVDAADELFHGGPFTDGLAYARAAQRLASNAQQEARTRYLAGIHNLNLGAYGDAQSDLTRALSLWRELGDRHGEADTRHALASIDLEQGAYDQARTEFTRGLDLRRELGDRRGEASARHELARTDLEQGAYDQARTEFTRALSLWRELGDRHGEASTRHTLARIDLEQGAYDQARTEFTRVLDLRRELGDRRGESAARHALASINLVQGAYDQARTEFTRALSLWRELGDRYGEASTRQALASIDLRQGAYDQARPEFTRVLDLRRELGDRRGEAAARHALASIDLEQGAYDQARPEFTRVLDLRRELGDRHGEAAARHQLASIDLEQGAYDQARPEFTRVLDLLRELGDRHGEAATRHALASIDLKQGAYDQARAEFTRVLDLLRELGDRQGEADALRMLREVATAANAS